jgi:ATP-dependent Clp protease ATP-binding subunit ClpA
MKRVFWLDVLRCDFCEPSVEDMVKILHGLKPCYEDFHNVILIMTSNAGAGEMSQKAIGFGKGLDIGQGQKAIERLFSPEFRNRLTEIVTFGKLNPAIMERIVGKFLKELRDQLSAKNVTMVASPAVVNRLSTDGYDERFGARPLARLIQSAIKRPLSEELLFGKL